MVHETRNTKDIKDIIIEEQIKSIGNINNRNANKIKTFDFTESEKREMFAVIDRDRESKDVLEFLKSGDMSIMERLYNNRIQTLQIWARKYHYIGMSQEDVFADMVTVFIKAVHKYRKNKRSKRYGKSKKLVVSETPFNTYLFYALQHYVINQWSRKRAKKRMSNDVPAENVTLSLNYSYNNPDDSACSLIDVVANGSENEKIMMDRIHLKETMDILSDGNKSVRKFLKRLSEDDKLTASLKELKLSEGRIKLRPRQASRFGSKRCVGVVRNFIKDQKNIISAFNLIEYYVKNNFLHYTIELKKTKMHDEINREMRRIRKNKDHYRHLLTLS